MNDGCLWKSAEISKSDFRWAGGSLVNSCDLKEHRLQKRPEMVLGHRRADEDRNIPSPRLKDTVNDFLSPMSGHLRESVGLVFAVRLTRWL